MGRGFVTDAEPWDRLVGSPGNAMELEMELDVSDLPIK